MLVIFSSCKRKYLKKWPALVTTATISVRSPIFDFGSVINCNFGQRLAALTQ